MDGYFVGLCEVLYMERMYSTGGIRRQGRCKPDLSPFLPRQSHIEHKSGRYIRYCIRNCYTEYKTLQLTLQLTLRLTVNKVGEKIIQIIQYKERYHTRKH